MLALQRSAGNQAVTRALLRSDRDGDGVEDEPSTDAWPRDAAGRLTDEALQRLEERVVAATRTGTHGERGVLRTTGSFQSVRGWTDARLNRALRLLADLDHGTDTTSRGRRTRRRRGAFDRPILAWESHLDDLGTPDRDTPEAQALEYQNILEFVDRLDQLSRSSMGMDYNPEFDPGAMDAMPRVRIAGAAVGVHPRALYFAAAAQVGMDEREGRAAGAGHYVPAGGLRNLLRDVADMASRLATERTPRRRRGAPRRRPRSAPIPGGGAIYATLHGELLRALHILEDQATGEDTVPGHHHDEHREPALRAFLVGRAERIRDLEPTVSDEDAATAAGRLAAVLDGLPGARHHGFGSIDPHGTEHAMGLAVDIYHGAGPGGSLTNFATERAYWPFIHRLIEHHGPSAGLDASLRPDSWGDLTPDASRALAGLVRDHGHAEAAAIAAEAAPDPVAARADSRTARRFTTLRTRALHALRNRRQAVRRARRDVHLDFRMVAEVDRELAALESDLARVPGLNVQELVLTIQRHHRALTNLEAHVEEDGDTGPPAPDPHRRHRRAPADPLRTVGPDDGPIDLTDLALDLDAMGPDVDAAIERHETLSLSELVRSRAFTRWLDQVSDIDRPIYDQPTTMVDALEDVEGTHFYGGHHWEIASLSESPGPSLLEDGDGTGTSTYATTLERDLARRSPETIERIISVMAESEGGRTAAFHAPDPTLHAGLAARLSEDTAAELLARVFTRVVLPFEGGSGDGAALRRDLRDRGFH